jgi:hypothetical protein
MSARIAADYHWLELLLHDQIATIAARGQLEPPLIVEDFAVLHFVAMTMEVYTRLGAVAVGHMNGHDFATMLEKAIERSSKGREAKQIEGSAVDLTPDN